MAKKRPKVPKRTEADLMFFNEHTCCICREKGKDVEIHHIDSDKKNNDMSNLSVLCLDCHSKVTGKRGRGRSYTPLEVSKNKRDWEYKVKIKRGLIHVPVRTSKKLRKTLYEFEIGRKIYQLIAIKDNDIKQIDEILEFLYLLSIFEDYTDIIFYHLFDATIWSGLGNNIKAAKIAKSIPDYFPHLVGPENVSINNKDKKRLDEAIELLGNIGNYSAQFNKKIMPVNVTVDSLSSIFNICIWYDLEDCAFKIVKELESIKKNCFVTYEKNERKLVSSAKKINSVLKKYEGIISKEKVKWKKVKSKIRRIINKK